MLDYRAKILLKALIERYIADGMPVGSRTLSKYTGLELSAASIRNIMADLEEMGLIASLHTSSGRVPTPRGYRLFVDTMVTVKPLEHDDELEVEALLQPNSPKYILSGAAHILSNLSHFAGVVLTPKRSQIFQHIEFLGLSDKKVLLIIVSPDGDVRNRIILTERTYTSSELIEAANFINENYFGMHFTDVYKCLLSELNKLRVEMSELMQSAILTHSHDADGESANVVISGEHKLLGVNDLADSMSTLRKLFAVFDNKTALLELLNVANQAEEMQIFIGGDSQVVPFDDVAVITAPYEIEGKIVGTLGVIGPTRMPYERVIPIVNITAKLLSQALNHNHI